MSHLNGIAVEVERAMAAGEASQGASNLPSVPIGQRVLPKS